MSQLLSEQGLETIRRAVNGRGMYVVAGILGVSRQALASVLLGGARPSTKVAVAAAYLGKARELEALQ